jgi:hypothetical protein
MPRPSAPLTLSREQILRFRRAATALDARLPFSAKALRTAAWCGLQDSMPRAALLSLHARVRGVAGTTWTHASLVQIWGPRFSAYVVAAKDLGIFSLGRLPDGEKGQARARETATRLHACLAGRRLPFGQAGREMRVPPNSLRYAAQTGTVVLHWDGARQPLVWTVPPPEMTPAEARLELARRFLHVFGPATDAAFARWAGIGLPEARRTFGALRSGLIAVRTPTGDAWILDADGPAFRARDDAAAPARLLPSGDTFFLAWGPDRELLVPDASQRARLWTSRVWPGAVLMKGDIAGTWRRDGARVQIDAWRRLTPAEWAALDAEVHGLPLPGPMSLDRAVNGVAVVGR